MKLQLDLTPWCKIIVADQYCTIDDNNSVTDPSRRYFLFLDRNTALIDTYWLFILFNCYILIFLVCHLSIVKLPSWIIYINNSFNDLRSPTWQLTSWQFLYHNDKRIKHKIPQWIHVIGLLLKEKYNLTV